MWVLIVLGSLVLLFILLLCVPVNALVDWDSARQPKIRFRLAWLFGIIRFTPRRKSPEKEAAHEKKKRRRPRWRRILKIITTRGLFGKVASFIRSCLRQVKVRELKGDIELEVEDPADAGFYYAAAGLVFSLFRLSWLERVSIRPVLGEEVALRGNARADVRVFPITLVVPTLRFVFSRPFLHVARISMFDKD